jgi:hypothetical protein
MKRACTGFLPVVLAPFIFLSSLTHPLSRTIINSNP